MQKKLWKSHNWLYLFSRLQSRSAALLPKFHEDEKKGRIARYPLLIYLLVLRTRIKNQKRGWYLTRERVEKDFLSF